MRSALAVLWLVATAPCGSALAATASRDILVVPDTIGAGTAQPIEIERGLLFVPENRAEPKSRTIAVHFVRFKAAGGSLTASTKRAPVFVLPGGPGSEFDFGNSHVRAAIDRMRRARDVIYVSQRGNPIAPGVSSALWHFTGPLPLDQPGSPQSTRSLHRSSVGDAINGWNARGVDLRGYDILNLVDDVHELRAALGYDKILLRGCSFGSQWAFAYLKRWSGTVDRALLSGVEPLDYAYDSPDWLWSSMSRLASLAEGDSGMQGHIPRGGLLAALKRSLERLNAKPVTVEIQTPKSSSVTRVALGAEDLQNLVRYPASFPGATRLQSLVNWPRFLIELDQGDYRYLAAKTWEARARQSRMALIGLLVDNSLGISDSRDRKLLAEPAAQWLGDINDYYHNTRDLTPTRRVSASFRADWSIDVPVLLVHGDLDWSTPIENARHARRFLQKGHLLEVSGATHCGETVEMADQLPDVLDRVYSFIDADKIDDASFDSLPASVSLSPLKFAVPSGPSLYEQWLQQGS